jgi:hypothetical protein
MVISALRDEAPWLFELGMEVHKALKLGDPRRISAALERFEHSLRLLRHTEMGHYLIDSPEIDIIIKELPHVVHRFIMREPRLPKPAVKSKNEAAKNE